MNKRLETLLSSVLTGCALVLAGTVVYRQFFTIPRVSVAAASAPTYVDNWESLLEEGLWIGERTAAVRVVEFGDFQCPYCKRFHAEFESIMPELGRSVALVYKHMPLEMHPYAAMAARSADCAAAHGRFAAMAHELYAQQDSIGTKPWAGFAKSAGIKDGASFAKCVSADSAESSAKRARTIAARYGVQGTPTVFINGWRLPVPPNADTLRRIARDIIAGRSPYRRT